MAHDYTIETQDVAAAMLAEHTAGARNCDLAKRFGLSPSRVGQELAKAKSVKRAGVLGSLSARTRNCLIGDLLLTVEDVAAALADGRLDKIPNFGAVSKAEVRQWLEGKSLFAVPTGTAGDIS